MTIPNILSLSRIPLLFIVVACLLVPLPGYATIALIAFILAFVSDWLDGVFARLLKQVTSVGALIDALIDKVFVLGLFLFFLHERLIPDWGLLPLIIMMSREFIITGLRQCALMQNQVLSAERPGKIKTVIQFLSLFLLLMVPYCQRELNGSPDIMALADFFKFTGRLTFALAAVLTVTSGAYYMTRYRHLLAYKEEEGE